eukprot:8368482-Alexandrium_andersonii.AAC.1
MPIAGVRRATDVRRRGGAQAHRALAAGTRHATRMRLQRAPRTPRTLIARARHGVRVSWGRGTACACASGGLRARIAPSEFTAPCLCSSGWLRECNAPSSPGLAALIACVPVG